MNVSLTKELEQFVQAQVKSGMYYSASEVIREGLRLLKEKDLLRQIKIEEFRKEISKGIDSIESGSSVPFEVEEIEAKERERLAAKKRQEI
ncbi:MAG: type II toxin-antitoxin system ParD family antitoxin [Pleurocapsa sp. MO_226.B13]|nr:type II toxin-antitoxin system ParD family antitoxin [Pleurocapsa sp. MO_226.B13]